MYGIWYVWYVVGVHNIILWIYDLYLDLLMTSCSAGSFALILLSMFILFLLFIGIFYGNHERYGGTLVWYVPKKVAELHFHMNHPATPGCTSTATLKKCCVHSYNIPHVPVLHSIATL